MSPSKFPLCLVSRNSLVLQQCYLGLIHIVNVMFLFGIFTTSCDYHQESEFRGVANQNH